MSSSATAITLFIIIDVFFNDFSAVSCIHVKTTGGEIDFDTHKYLGYYKLIDDMINNHRTWKLSSNGRAKYLYRHINGKWYFGSVLGSSMARIFSRISGSPLTTDLMWKYYNGSKWKDSSTLTVSSRTRCSGRSGLYQGYIKAISKLKS